jgi:hypothetical protein
VIFPIAAYSLSIETAGRATIPSNKKAIPWQGEKVVDYI